MRSVRWFVVMALLLVGCSSSFRQAIIAEPLDYPIHIYEQPFDLVYLKTLETIDEYPGWAFHRTAKERGIIEMHHDKLICRGVSKNRIEFDAYPKGYTRDTKLTTVQDYTACRDAMCRMFDL